MLLQRLFLTGALAIVSIAATFSQSQKTNASGYAVQKQITCTKGAVVSAHPLASIVGLDILKQGAMHLMQPLPRN